MRTLYRHQKKVMTWAKGRREFPLFIEMRLGKSLICVRLAKRLKSKRNLVICPKPAFEDWKRELKLEGYRRIKDYRVLSGSVEQKMASVFRGKKWYIANYESISACPTILDQAWEFIIVDESTRLKNPGTGISKLICSRTQHIPFRAILSGHPAPEGIENYYQQMKFLFGEFMRTDNFWEWRNKNFFIAGYDWIPYSNKKHVIMNELSRVSYFLTRKDAGLFRKKIYERRTVIMDSSKQRRMYEEVVEEFQTGYKKKKYETKFIPVQVSWLCRIASGFTPDGKHIVSTAKHKEILSLMETELKGEKIVIWFKHNDELVSVAKFLKCKGYKVGMFYGGNKTGVQLFKTGKLDALCIQQKCGMVSLDLSISSTSIYFSNWWSSEMRIQSEDRILSMKKKEPLLIIDLVTEKTIDEDILFLLKTKKTNAKRFAHRLAQRIFNERR